MHHTDRQQSKVLFFLSHPAHFHFFKHAIGLLRGTGTNIQLVIKEKDVLRRLLDAEGFAYDCIQGDENTTRGRFGLSILARAGFSLLKRDLRLFSLVQRFRPNLLVGSETSIAHVGRLLRIPSVVTNEDDWFLQKEFVYPTYPFASTVVAPRTCDVGPWEKKRVAYDGYQKLAYLHPRYFRPRRSVAERLSPDGRPYILLRLVSLTAHHDIGKRKLSAETVQKLIDQVGKDFRVWLSAEGSIDDAFKAYQLDLPPSQLHDALYFARLLVGDSQSMTVEAAMLGTPAIRISDFVGTIGVLNELEEKYQLCHGLRPSEVTDLPQIVSDVLYQEDKQVYRDRARRMRAEKIDVTEFLHWFLSRYSASRAETMQNGDWQNAFRNGSEDFKTAD
jgi:predicted glycosyltransferase